VRGARRYWHEVLRNRDLCLSMAQEVQNSEATEATSRLATTLTAKPTRSTVQCVGKVRQKSSVRIEFNAVLYLLHFARTPNLKLGSSSEKVRVRTSVQNRTASPLCESIMFNVTRIVTTVVCRAEQMLIARGWQRKYIQTIWSAGHKCSEENSG
jgi:hypothetical protein